MRVRVRGGSHAKDGQRWARGDVLEVSKQEYELLSFKFERLSDEAEPEPLTEETIEEEPDQELTEAWAEVDATDAAVELALENDLSPDDVEGTGLDGRVLVSDVRDIVG